MKKLARHIKVISFLLLSMTLNTAMFAHEPISLKGVTLGSKSESIYVASTVAGVDGFVKGTEINGVIAIISFIPVGTPTSQDIKRLVTEMNFRYNIKLNKIGSSYYLDKNGIIFYVKDSGTILIVDKEIIKKNNQPNLLSKQKPGLPIY